MLERSYFLHNKIERTTFASNKRKQPECLKYRREYADEICEYCDWRTDCVVGLEKQVLLSGYMSTIMIWRCSMNVKVTDETLPKRNKQIREREEEDDREAVITQSLQNAELRLRFANVRILGGKFSLSNTSTPISPECWVKVTLRHVRMSLVSY